MLRIKQKPKEIIKEKPFEKIKGCVVTDSGCPGKYFNCVECFYLIISDICTPNSIEKYLNHSTFFINATKKSLETIPFLKKHNKKIILILECSESFRHHKYLENYDIINSVDLILCQFGSPYKEIIESYFRVPIKFFGVPALPNEIFNFVKKIEKHPLRIHVNSLDISQYSDFNSQTNFNICKQIQEKIPEVVFVSSSVHPVYKKYLKNIIETGGVPQYKYWEILRKCSLSINMMDRITWGRYLIDNCSVLTPIINSYCGAADLCKINYYKEFDIKNTVEEAIRLLTDESYNSKITISNFEKIKFIEPGNMKCKLNGMMV